MSQIVATASPDAAEDEFVCADGVDASLLLAALLAAPAGCGYDDWYIAPGCDAAAFLGAIDERPEQIGGAS